MSFTLTLSLEILLFLAVVLITISILAFYIIKDHRRKSRCLDEIRRITAALSTSKFPRR